MTDLTIGTRRVTVAGGYRYIGQLRDGRAVLVECGHEHDNRNQSTRTSGESATDCMVMTLRATALPALREDRINGYQAAWQRLTRNPFGVPASTIEAAKADSACAADAYAHLVDHVAGILRDHGLRVDTKSFGARLVPINLAA